MIKSFLFDLNGTMIDDMSFHQKVWFGIINGDLKGNLTEDEVKKEMYGKNEELLVRIFGEERFTDEEMQEISAEKERRYQKEFLPHLKLINGLDDFLKTARSNNITMGVASAAVGLNIDFVIDNLDIRELFGALVSADDVKTSKPDPETFLSAAQLLNSDPKDCIVFEDAPKGVEAAANAEMQTVVLTTTHKEEDFKQYSNIIAFIRDYTDPILQQLFKR